MITAVEEMSLKVPKSQVDDLRRKWRQTLANAKALKPNRREEIFTIKTFILPADKGNASVVMDK